MLRLLKCVYICNNIILSQLNYIYLPEVNNRYKGNITMRYKNTVLNYYFVRLWSFKKK